MVWSTGFATEFYLIFTSICFGLASSHTGSNRIEFGVHGSTSFPGRVSRHSGLERFPFSLDPRDGSAQPLLKAFLEVLLIRRPLDA